MYNLTLYDRAAISTTSHRQNITQIARNWRRSIRAVGGFWTGDFTISAGDMSRYWLVDLYNHGIGYRVVEQVGGFVSWEGEIVQLRLTLNGVTWLRSMDPERWRNRIYVMWGGGVTSAADDIDSQAQYGISEYVDQGSAVYDLDAAEARRDRILARDAFPRSHAESGLVIDPDRELEADGLSVTCAGYVFALNRQYRWENIAAANISSQISTLVGLSDYISAGNIATNTTQSAVILAGIPMRLWDAAAELIRMGDDSGNEWVGGVYADRLFQYAAAETDVTHQWRGGRLYNLAGNPIFPARVRPDIIVEVVGAPRAQTPVGGATQDQPNRVYIEEVEFQAPDKLTLIPRQPEPTPETLNELTRRVIGFSDKYAAFRHAVSAFSNLPGLRGLWTMAEYDTSGNAEDQTNYDLLLTLNGNTEYNYDGLAPYVEFDGANGYLGRADEAALSITGTEGHLDADIRGMTCGGWFYMDDLDAAVNAFISKWTSVGTLSYLLCEIGGNAYFYVSGDGTALTSISGSTVAAGSWYFIVGRFDPSTSLCVFANGVKSCNTTAIPASIADTASDFHLGRDETDASYLDGRESLVFLCASALSDDMIGALFQQSRALYGV